MKPNQDRQFSIFHWAGCIALSVGLTACGGGGSNASDPPTNQNLVKKNSFDLTNPIHLRLAAAGAMNFFSPSVFWDPESRSSLAMFLDRPESESGSCSGGGTYKDSFTYVGDKIANGDKLETISTSCIFADPDGSFKTESNDKIVVQVSGLQGDVGFNSTSAWSAVVDQNSQLKTLYEGYSFISPAKLPLEKGDFTSTLLEKIEYAFDPKTAGSTADDVVQMRDTVSFSSSGTLDAKPAALKNETKASCSKVRADAKTICTSVTATITGTRSNFGTFDMTLRNVGDVVIETNPDPSLGLAYLMNGKFEVQVDDQVIKLEMVNAAPNANSIRITGPSGVTETLRVRYFEELKVAF